MVLWWDDSPGGNCSAGRNTCPSGTLYTTNIIRTDLWSNPGLRDEGVEKNVDVSGGSGRQDGGENNITRNCINFLRQSYYDYQIN
jgi:hypothetical protein